MERIQEKMQIAKKGQKGFKKIWDDELELRAVKLIMELLDVKYFPTQIEVYAMGLTYMLKDDGEFLQFSPYGLWQRLSRKYGLNRYRMAHGFLSKEEFMAVLNGKMLNMRKNISS